MVWGGAAAIAKDFDRVLAEKRGQKDIVKKLAIADAEAVPAMTDEAAPSLSGSSSDSADNKYAKIIITEFLDKLEKMADEAYDFITDPKSDTAEIDKDIAAYESRRSAKFSRLQLMYITLKMSLRFNKLLQPS